MKFNKVTADQKRDLFFSRGTKNDLNFARFVHDVFVAHESMSHFFKFWRALMHPCARRCVAPSSWRPKVSADVHKKTDIVVHFSSEDGKDGSQCKLQLDLSIFCNPRRPFCDSRRPFVH